MAIHRSSLPAKRRRKQNLAEQRVIASDQWSPTSTSLIRRAKGHKDDAWFQLVDTYSLMVYRWCRRAGLPPDDANDVCQEVFTAVARKIGDFRRDRGRDGFRKWIRVITTNKIRDYWRLRKAAAVAVGGTTWLGMLDAIAESCVADTPSTLLRPCLDEDLRDEAVLQVRADVSERDWAIFARLVLEDGCPREVADEFGVSSNVVYLTKSRILKRLRTQLESRALTRDA